jgi:hypothetical protein
MRKAIFVSLVLVAAILICGCAGNHGKQASADGGGDQLPPDSESPDQATEVGSVSQEDLDRLQNDLHALEFDEPGGLSGE